MKYTYIILGLLMMGSVAMTAQEGQKIGHMNSQELLALMPERAEAETQMQTLNAQLEERLNTLSTEYQSKLEAFQALPADSPQSTVTDLQEELLTMQQRIQEFRANAEQDLVKKQEELLQPMLEKLQTAVDALGQEQGLTYIMDTSAGSIVFVGPDAIDITQMLKDKLGIQG